MDPPRIIDGEPDFLELSFPLQAALQRWENEGGAGPDRLPAGFMTRDDRSGIAARTLPVVNTSINHSRSDFSALL
jgi:hypothetical protein